MRLYLLAKELNMPSKDLVEKLQQEGYEYKHPQNTLVPDAIDKMRTLYGPLPERPQKKRPTEKKDAKPATTKKRKFDDKKKPHKRDGDKPPQDRRQQHPKQKDAPTHTKGKPTTKPSTKPDKEPTPAKPASPDQPTTTPTVRKIADLPSSVVKGSDGKITIPSSVAKSVQRQKVDLPDKEKIAKQKPVVLKDFSQLKKTHAVDDYDDDKDDEKTSRTPRRQRDKKKSRKDTREPSRPPVYMGGESVRVVMPTRRGKDRGKQQGVVVKRTGVEPPTKFPHKKKPKDAPKPVEFVRPEKIKITMPITVRDLSAKMGIKATDIIRKLMLEQGAMITINDYLDEEAVYTIGLEYDTEIEIGVEKDHLEELKELQEDPSTTDNLIPRSPVVAFLGHVDHGKTSLLDAVRKTRIQEKEAGGITQNFTAWTVNIDDKQVVFLDTPGHEAFTEMRSRGANVTDIVVLVVATDDGVMPQTEEAVNHAKAAGVSIVVALNKIDKPNSNAMRTKQQLAALDLNPPEWGGKTEMVETSATTGEGIRDLLETLILEAEILELTTNPDKPARGVVLESEKSEGRGVVARLLIKDGKLKVGDTILAGAGYGRVRTIIDSNGKNLTEAGAPLPVEVSGLDDVPLAGDLFYVLKDLAQAREIAFKYRKKQRDVSLAKEKQVTLENIFTTIAEEAVKEICLIIKADVTGSVEVLTKSLTDISTPEIKVKIIHAAVGGVNESDVLLADASGAIIFAFNVAPDDKARILAEEKRIDIRRYSVIYSMIDDLKKAIEGLLDPEEREEINGHAVVRQTFKASKIGTIAGCMVQDGTIQRQNKIRVIRDGVVIYTGVLDSLKRFKEDAKEVKEGFECGIKVKGYNDIKEGDTLEAYTVKQIARTFEDSKSSQ